MSQDSTGAGSSGRHSDFGEGIPDIGDSKAKAENGRVTQDIQGTVGRAEWKTEMEQEVGQNLGGPHGSY